jgi:meso-butanediol dehydrogenase/(S,S)-butanediol dehydrogenase/diacetyl reductase
MLNQRLRMHVDRATVRCALLRPSVASPLSTVSPRAFSSSSAPAAEPAAPASLRSYDRFVGRSVIVTGGAAGIGEAIVRRFLAEGARVCSVDSAPQPAPPAALAARLLPLRADVSDAAAVEAAVARACAAHGGGVDVLVNNAAAFHFADVVDATEAQWRACLDVNVRGYANTMRACVLRMRARGRGAVVNVSSMSALIAQEKFVPYSTSKAAQAHMTRLVALDEGRHGIRVNAVLPGPIFTEGTRRHAKGVGLPLERVVADMVGGLAIKRMGSVDEVASAVLFLASDDASFTTGSSLQVDGGYTLA